MKPGHRLWTEDEIATLVRMKSTGADVATIAKHLGRTYQSTANKASSYVSVTVAKEPAPERPPAPRYASRMAIMMGDPPIGRSALDQKRASA